MKEEQKTVNEEEKENDDTNRGTEEWDRRMEEETM